MKLGTQTGSLTNHIFSRMTKGQPKPFVGMGVTLLGWTDRHAGTITHILKGGILAVRQDIAKRTDNNGMSESQTYEYSPNPDGNLYHFRQNQCGGWDEVAFSETTQRWSKTGGFGLRLGERREYYDFSF